MEGLPLRGQVALVTGGSRGIGRAISETLWRQGASVAVNYAKSAATAESIVAELNEHRSPLAPDQRAIAIGFDVASEEAVEAGVRAVLGQLQNIDILVNNAGIAIDGLLVRTKGEDWQRTIATNLSSCFYTARAVAKGMMKSRRGRIVNVSSVIGEMGNAGQVAYSASKSGIFGLTKSLARELGSRNVTVNAVTPGFIDTDMTSEMSDEQKNGLLSQVALGRLGKVEDVANLVSFLVSPGAEYITGQIIGVNGGLYM